MEDKTPIRKTGALLLAINASLVIVKGVGWYLTGSLALKTEFVNSIIDLLYTVVIVGGLYASLKSPTEKYPEGLRRLEPFISLVVAVSISVTGILLAYSSVLSIENPVTVSRVPLGIGILVLGSIVKVWLYKYCIRVGKAHEMPSLKAVGLENRNDILTGIVALVGLFGVAIGFPLMDSIAALIVSILILYSGFAVAYENIGYIIGRAPSEEERQRLVQSALSHNEVHGIHDTRIHYSGPVVDVSMHLEVEGDMTVEEAHRIEVEVRKKVRESYDGIIGEVNLHIDPKTLDEWDAKRNS